MARHTRNDDDGPIIHAAGRPGASAQIHMGSARCGVGTAARTEGEQYVSGAAAAYVTCQRCQRLGAVAGSGPRRGHLPYTRDLPITNLAQLPRGLHAGYLLCLQPHAAGGPYLAKAWKRRAPARLAATEVLIVFGRGL